jgi:hypothetical protein
MRPALLLLLALVLPAAAQIRTAPSYDGTSPGHPADEPGPELGATAEDAFILLSRGDRDAARLSAARCLRGNAADPRCRLVVEAVEAGVEAPKIPAMRADAIRAEVHFRAGADWYFHDELGDARREWDACRRLDPGHPFCALGLRLAPASGRRLADRQRPPGEESRPAPDPLPRPATGREGIGSAQQQYLTGMIYFQKGDYERARDAWVRCSRAPESDSTSDCRVGLRKIEQLYGSGGQ